MKNDVITLVGKTFAKDKYGVMRETAHTCNVMAEIKSAGASEWFEGGRMGLNPQYTFVIRRIEYHKEEAVIFENVKYSVYRTYINGDRIELHVQEEKGA